MIGNPGCMRRIAHLVVTCSAGDNMYRKDGVDYRVIKEGERYLLQMKLVESTEEEDWDTVLVSSTSFS